MKSLSAELTAQSAHQYSQPSARGLPEQAGALARARAFAEPLLASETLDTGENVLAHADAVAGILSTMGGSEAMQAASYLVYACDHLNKPHEVIAKAFGDNFADLAMETTKLVRVQRMARVAQQSVGQPRGTPIHGADGRRPDRKRAQDAAGVLARSARGDAAPGLAPADAAPLCGHQAAGAARPGGRVLASVCTAGQPAGHLGGQVGDGGPVLPLSGARHLPPGGQAAGRKARGARSLCRAAAPATGADLAAQGIQATVQGRPKHIYSIVKKMRGKSLGFDQVYDIRALRIVVPTVPDCYAALSWVHSQFVPVTEEFDDYIAKPKANGYQSLHTVVRDAGGPAD